MLLIIFHKKLAQNNMKKNEISVDVPWLLYGKISF